jgi:hypothetical protein
MPPNEQPHARFSEGTGMFRLPRDSGALLTIPIADYGFGLQLPIQNPKSLSNSCLATAYSNRHPLSYPTGENHTTNAK